MTNYLRTENMEKKSQTLNTPKVIASLLAIIVLILAQGLSMLIGNLPAMLGLPAAIGNIIAGLFYPFITLLGLWILCKKILKLSLADCKITKPRLRLIWCMAAFIMPVLVCVVLIFMPGHWENTSLDTKEVWTFVTGAVCFYGFAVGIVEEAVFRGVIMSALEYCWNKWIAIIVPSVIFGLLHIIGNDLDFLSIVQLLIAGSIVGILFSMVTYASGSIWCSAFMHGIWNIIMVGGILHIGTQTDETSIFNYVLDTKSFLISGGDFGVEASIISVAAYFLFTVLAVWMYKKRAGMKAGN